MQDAIHYLTANRERFVSELCEYVRFASVSAQTGHRDDMLKCAGWLAEHCRQIGLKAEVCETAGHPIVLASTPRKPGAGKPHYLIYGHYDVQPAEPFELWKTRPFEPQVVNNAIYGRGASDNKGQHFAHLKAVEAMLKTGAVLPCDLTFIIEGEEEVGSSSLTEFLKKQRNRLRCAGVVISDTGMPDKKHPALTYALRGVAAMEVKVIGPSRDLHSGMYGGSLKNPATALCEILGRLHDRRGRVAVPGFYDDVKKLSRFERRQLARIPFNATAYRKFLGVPSLFGESGYTPVEQRSARPTLEINGLTSGYQGSGSKTIVPAWASAKLTMRLVPEQKPLQIIRLVERQIRRLCPPGVRLEISYGHACPAYMTSPRGPQTQAALRALKAAFGHEPVLLREGGSIPVVTDFKNILGVDSLLLGLALPDDNAHSPNEKFDLECFERGMVMSLRLWEELAQAKPAGC